MRRNLRRKFRAAEKAPVIEMTVVDDVAPIVKDIYPPLSESLRTLEA
jgi:hypothetical protein